MKRELLQIPSDEDALMLSGIVQIPDGKIHGIVHLVHGMCEHKERYQHVLDALCMHGYVSLIFDMRGHGKSVRCREDLGYFNDDRGVWIVNDIHQIVYQMKKRFPDLPYILAGHSMGSLAVRCYLKRYDYEVDGAVICGSPSNNSLVLAAMGLCRCMKRVKGAYYRSPLMHRLVFHRYEHAFEEEGKNAWLCTVPEVVSAYDEDPACGFNFTLNAYQNLFYLLYNTYDEEGWIKRQPSLPVLFIAGEQDPCIVSRHAWMKAIQKMQAAGYVNLTFKLYEGARHEILNEKCRGEVITDLIRWTDSICTDYWKRYT